VIDSDGHYHEPHSLFDEFMDKEYLSRRPRILALKDHPLEVGRWVFEGKVVPRIPFSKGVGAGGFDYMAPRHPRMHMKDNTLDDVEVVKMGREVRFHDMFAPAGTNVNFICPIKDDTIGIRTYERGVEDETLACGTGSVAGALIMARKMKIDAPINVLTRSGVILKIYYKEKNGTYQDIYLEGDARIIYRAELFEDAWNDNS